MWVGRRNKRTADLLSKVGLSKADLALEAVGSPPSLRNVLQQPT